VTDPEEFFQIFTESPPPITSHVSRTALGLAVRLQDLFLAFSQSLDLGRLAVAAGFRAAQLGPDKQRLAVAFIRSRFTESSRTSPFCLLLFKFFCLMAFFAALWQDRF
jgi:hypothetical protein